MNARILQRDVAIYLSRLLASIASMNLDNWSALIICSPFPNVLGNMCDEPPGLACCLRWFGASTILNDD